MQCRKSLLSWQHLETLAETMKSQHLNDLFSDDPNRFSKLSLELPFFLFDYSKNRVTAETMSALFGLAREVDVEGWRERMFAGERINNTENRAVMHVALRNCSEQPIYLDGVNICAQVEGELERMQQLVERVRSGEWSGHTGKSITDVVSLGVGGSNLGPQMVTEALKPYCDNKLRMHYVSNVDGAQIADTLASLDPERVLFIVSSKTFTTTETMINARTALKWMRSTSSNDQVLAKHFIGITANCDNAKEFGIPTDNLFAMWDWVGGRFSLWSAIGLPIALAVGFEKFKELLEGAYDMDCHFRDAPLEQNAPMILALIGVWNNTFLGSAAQAVLPYDQNLHLLPSYLQQAEMESNGKSVSWHGEEVPYNTGALIWGQLGINGQHAFYQYLHQGKTVVPADFIASMESSTPVEDHHENLMANFFAQTKALMTGVGEERVREDLAAKGMTPECIDQLVAHKVHQGNRPTNTLLLKRLDAKSLGALIALYEHKIFVQGIIWQVHSFDQWGVELGKTLAQQIEPELDQACEVGAHDSSTVSQIAYFKRVRQEALSAVKR